MIRVVLICLLLTGCGTVGTITNPKDTDFVVVSQSQAGGVYKLLRGATSLCKLSKHGVTGLKYNITFEDGACKVEATK
jgi:uncharacterized protein YceK